MDLMPHYFSPLEGGRWNFAFLFFFAIPGLIMGFISVLLVSFLKIKATVVTGFICSFLMCIYLLNSYLLVVGYSYRAYPNYYLAWASVILFVIMNICLIFYIKPSKMFKSKELLQKQQRKIEEEQELLRQMREYLLKITNVYNRLSFDEIITNLGLRSKYSRLLIKTEIKPKLRMMIEDLIYNNKLKAQINGEELILSEHQLFQANQSIEMNSHTDSLNQSSFVPSTPTPLPPQSYHQTGKTSSNYLLLGIILILIGVGFLIVGISAFIIFIPIFSNFYIGEILGGVLIFMGIRYIKKGK